MQIGNRYFDTENETYVMGILNVTPDSFSDGGRYNTLDSALYHAEQMLRDGADILDIGGESTRPGYTPVTVEEEIGRICPVIRAVRERFDVPVSADTCKSAVAQAAIESGASLINDIWGCRADPDMAGVIAEHDVSCCLMHNRNSTDYHDFMTDLKKELLACAAAAEEAGVSRDRIILDPGVGFGKTYEQNLLTIRRLNELQALGYPVLLGTSRKSVIGLTLDLPSDQRLEGTLVTTVCAVQAGCAFVRVHDVLENRRAIQMTRAIMRSC